jgi:predicted DNA-binding protein with PD1-like motif
MRAKVLSAGPPRVFTLVFDVGDECVDGLRAFADEAGLRAAWFVGLGAFREATIAFFLVDEKRYEETAVGEQVEVASLTGNVAIKEGRPAVHAHAVLGRRDGSALAGHLVRGIVQPTLEVVVSEGESALVRALDGRFDLPLIDLDRGEGGGPSGGGAR